MNFNGLDLHYHNSLKTAGPGYTRYKPNTEIITEPLTKTYAIGEQIGRGKFAVVKKCTNLETKEVVAAKFIKKRRRGKTCRDEILREVVMLEMALDHPRLVNLKEVYETQSELILITEYCAGGELFTECIIEEKFSERDVRLLMSQILEGLVYLHEKSIVHLDIKPQNILLTEPFPKGTVKICDLGFACLVNTGEDIRDIIGTPDYVAPEVLNYDPLGLYTDMWSLGVLTYVMLTQCSPFAGDDKQQTFCNITTVQLDFPEDLFRDISDPAQDFIKKLLIAKPDQRMTAKECLEHPWITGSLSVTGNLSSRIDQVSFEQGTGVTESLDSLLNHSNLDNQTKTLTDSSDALSSSSQEITQDSSMAISESKSSVCSDLSSIVSNCNCSNNTSADKHIHVELTSEKELESLDEEDSEVVNQIEAEVDMDTKSELHNSMEISFTKDDLEKECEKNEESISANETISQHSSYLVNEDTEMRNRSASESDSSFVDRLNSSNLDNSHNSDNTVQIVVKDTTNEASDMELTSPGVIEIDLHGVSASSSLTPEITTKENNSNDNATDNVPSDSQSNTKISENPYKRGMCNDSSPSPVVTSKQSEDEIQYEFISVSKRVRNYEDALTPQKSPQISPKSPRSPRISRLQRRSSHHNTPKSPF